MQKKNVTFVEKQSYKSLLKKLSLFTAIIQINIEAQHIVFVI